MNYYIITSLIFLILLGIFLVFEGNDKLVGGILICFVIGLILRILIPRCIDRLKKNKKHSKYHNKESKVKAKDQILLTRDEVDSLKIPIDITKFFNQELFEIIKKGIYPKASIFELIQRGKITDCLDPEVEKRTAIRFQLEIGNSCVCWACVNCLRIIGLVRNLPNELEKKYPSEILNNLHQLFMTYAHQQRLRCPNCDDRGWFLLKPNFLISGKSLQSEFDMYQKK